MKTRVCLLVAGILATIALMGCNGGNGEDEEAGPTATASAAGEETVTVPADRATAAPETASPEATPVPSPTTPLESNGLAVDALPGGSVDAARTVPSGTSFDVDIVVTAAPNAYKAYQYTLEWDPVVLAYVDLTYPKAGGLDVCPPPTRGADNIYGGCAGFTPTDFVGTVSTVTLECVEPGTSALHLQPLSDNPTFGTGMTLEPGLPLPTDLADAEITCE